MWIFRDGYGTLMGSRSLPKLLKQYRLDPKDAQVIYLVGKISTLVWYGGENDDPLDKMVIERLAIIK